MGLSIWAEDLLFASHIWRVLEAVDIGLFWSPRSALGKISVPPQRVLRT